MSRHRERDVAVSVVRQLQSRGHIAVLAGGCVRDEIMGREPKDYDVATSARPEVVEAIFPRTIAVGKAFGVVVVVDGEEQVEVATLRNDGQYSDGRRPESVRFVADLREDAARRDFTMNAMFKDPLTGEIFDFFGGREDIAAGVIRAVGDPKLRIEEDRLRMMRAVRFAARYGFHIHPTLFQSILENAAGIVMVSWERKCKELEGILTSANPVEGLDVLLGTRLMEHVLPEVIELSGPDADQNPQWHPEGNVWVHTRMVVENLKGGSFELVLGGLLHDIAKPRTIQRHPDGGISNHKHAEVGAEMARDICRRLKMSNDQTHRVCELVRLHMQMHVVKELRRSKLVALLARPDIQDLIALQHADATGTGCPNCGENSHREFLLSQLSELSSAAHGAQRVGADALMTGDRLITLGFKPGPAFKGMLAEALDAQREGVFATAQEAERWVLERYALKKTLILVAPVVARAATGEPITGTFRSSKPRKQRLR